MVFQAWLNPQSLTFPRLISSVGVSVVGAAYLLANGGSVKAETHGASAREAHGESPSSHDDPGQKSLEGDAGDASINQAPQGGDDEKTEKDQSAAPPGQDVPPPPADNSSGSENTEDKKEKHEEYKDTVCFRELFRACFPVLRG